MKTLALIPARGGSKGLARKNLRPLHGRPLVVHAIEAAIKSKAVDRILVSTDDDEIAAVARAAGAEVPFLRPTEVSGDTTTTEETLRQALGQFEQHTGEQFDIGVYLTPTDVFRRPEWIAEAVSRLASRPELESVFTAQLSFKNYWEELPECGFQRLRPYMQTYGQRQERMRNKRLIWREDTGRTLASRTWLWREGRRIGNQVDIIPTEGVLMDLDVHDELDFHLIEKAMEWLEGRNPQQGA